MLPADQLDSYIAGLILLAAAPCTAMVFVWSQLCQGRPVLHAVAGRAERRDHGGRLRAASSALLLGLSSITVPWDTLLTSVGLYIVIPVIIAQLWRKAAAAQGKAHFAGRASHGSGPLSIAALLLTLVLLFAFQGEAIMRAAAGHRDARRADPDPGRYFNSGLAYWLNRRLGVAHCVAGPSALIGASNFFELAVATAISLFGFQSGAALATVSAC